MFVTVVVTVLLGGAEDTADTVVAGGVGGATLVLGITGVGSLSSQIVFRLPLRLLSRPLHRKKKKTNDYIFYRKN